MTLNASIKMGYAKWGVRLFFLILALVLLSDINNKSKDGGVTVAEFKFKTFQKLQADSLDSKSKLKMVIGDTKEFLDNSTNVRRSINHLIILLVLVGTFELIVFLYGRRNYS